MKRLISFNYFKNNITLHQLDFNITDLIRIVQTFEAYGLLNFNKIHLQYARTISMGLIIQVNINI